MTAVAVGNVHREPEARHVRDAVSRARGDAAAEIVRMGGGAVVTRGGDVLAGLSLPVAGLMSALPLVEVRSQLDALTGAAMDCGAEHPDPLMALSLVALEVIPALKLTDRGLVDVETFDFVPLVIDHRGGP